MTIQVLTQFFKWCTLINGGLLFLWTISWLLAPDLMYHTQQKWFYMSKESFNLFFYGFLGFFKIMFLFFNLVPWLALLILG